MEAAGGTNSFDSLGKLAVSAAGVGAGGVFSWRLFTDLGVQQLLASGTVYGLTVLAFVGGIVMVAGYALSSPATQAIATTMRLAIGALFACAFLGTVYQIWLDHDNPSIGFSVVFRPTLETINAIHHLNQDDALSAELGTPIDGDVPLIKGRPQSLVHLKKGDQMTIDMESLTHLVDDMKVDDSAVERCGDGGCPTKPSNAPNSRAHIDAGFQIPQGGGGQ